MAAECTKEMKVGEARETAAMGNFQEGIPKMVAICLSGRLVTFSVRLKLQNAIPVSVFILGTLWILRGVSLGIPYASSGLSTKGSVSCCQR
jgi:hypothetical protein